MRKALHAILDSPWAHLVVAIMMVLSGIAEVIDGIGDVTKTNVGAHHGIILFGATEILKALLRIYEGLEKVERAVDRDNGE